MAKQRKRKSCLRAGKVWVSGKRNRKGYCKKK